jgi:glycerophosphoryl diester phosphodiesterase
MIVIIAGSRDIEDYQVIKNAVELSQFDITEVVSGGARGVDQTGEAWARKHNIPIKRFLPDWKAGKSAGIMRNLQMSLYADGLIAVWDGVSRGTAHMIGCARRRGLKVFVYEYAKLRQET